MSTINNLPFNLPPSPAGFGGAGMPMLEQSPFGAAPMQQADAISPFGSAWSNGAYGSYGGTSFGAAGGLGGILGSFSSFISNLFNEIAGWFGMGGGSPAPGGTSSGPISAPGSPVPGAPVTGPIGGGYPARPGEQFYASADASSWGDPHDSFNGSTANGQAVDAKWNSMTSHSDLLDSDSFSGGLRVSTQVTQPNANGVTHNQSATVTTNNGNTQVTMNADGTTSITSYGQSYTIAPGQSVNLGNGETVTANQNGSLTVNMQNANGGSVAISLTAQGGGVNVNAQASNVDLGGYLARQGAANPTNGGPSPISSPIQPGPIGPTPLPFGSGAPVGYGSGPIAYGSGAPAPWESSPEPFNLGPLANAFAGLTPDQSIEASVI